MQAEMERGGGLWFDLFVAMCNHMVCVSLSLPFSIAETKCKDFGLRGG